MAIEFSLVCLPFIYMTIAIIELCIFFASANTLEFAINSAARSIRTGQLQTNNPGNMQQAFMTDLCSRLLGLIDCSKIDLEVMPMPDSQFTSAPTYAPVYDAQGRLVSRGFDPGTSGNVVLLRVAYRYPLWTPLFSNLFSTQPDHTIPLLSTVVLQNEPYNFNPNAS